MRFRTAKIVRVGYRFLGYLPTDATATSGWATANARLSRFEFRERCMATTFRLAGLSEATVDNEKQDISFVLKVADGRGLAFVADAAAARQIASSLGRVALQARQVTPQMIGAEKIAQYGVKREAFGEVVLLQLVSEDGVPYMFALPLQAATDIASRLQIESAKNAGTGRA